MHPTRDHTSTSTFTPVPVTPRRNGWTPERQRLFLTALAETGSVALASARAGMTKRSAYRLRARGDAAAFAARWDAALRTARDRTRPPRSTHRATPSNRQMFQAIRALFPESFARPRPPHADTSKSPNLRDSCRQPSDTTSPRATDRPARHA